MNAKDLIETLQKCNPDADIELIQEESLECIPEWWDDEIGDYGGVTDKVTELYSWDLYSHEFYLLAIKPEKG
jgi:hypothetical protein